MNGITQIDVLPSQATPTVRLDGQVMNLTARDHSEWVKWGFAVPSDSGIAVTPQTALRHSPVFQAISILSGDIAQLEFMVRRISGDSKTHAPQHRVDWAIHREPNEWQTIDAFYESMMVFALGWGNGVAAIEESGGDYQLSPLPPDVTKHEEVEHGVHLITTRIDDVERAYTPGQVIHIPGLSQNGFWGLSAVKTCQNRLGHGMAMLKHGNNFFRNGARPSSVITVPQNVDFTPTARSNFRREWDEQHGSGKVQPAFLYDGMDYKTVSMSNEDAQWIESTELDLLFVAGVFNLPPYKLGYMKDSSVRSNLEAQQREYYNTSLARWAVRFVRQFEKKLFRPSERRSGRFEVHVNLDSLTQGTRKERMETVALGVRTRLLTRNEGREEIGRNPVDGGDDFENPAIDTAAEDTTVPSEPDENVENALRQRGVAALISAESGRIKHAAKTVKNFVAWIDDFCANYMGFAEVFLGPLADLAEVDWRPVCQEHAIDLRNELLAITDFARPDGLAQQVNSFLKGRDSLVSDLTAAIMESRHG